MWDDDMVMWRCHVGSVVKVEMDVNMGSLSQGQILSQCKKVQGGNHDGGRAVKLEFCSGGLESGDGMRSTVERNIGSL